MEVILLKDSNLGRIGNIVNVKNGYARNYLIPRKIALLATEANKQVFEAKKAELEKANNNKLEHAKEIANKIENLFVTIIRQAAEDGRLFGSVSAKDIMTEVNNAVKEAEIDKHSIVINTVIKSIGIYKVSINLHSQVTSTINVNVARSEAEAKDAKEAFLNPDKLSTKAKKAKEQDLEQVEPASPSEE